MREGISGFTASVVVHCTMESRCLGCLLLTKSAVTLSMNNPCLLCDPSPEKPSVSMQEGKAALPNLSVASDRLKHLQGSEG